MIRSLCIATSLIALAAAVSPTAAKERRVASLDANGNSSGNLDVLIARHAAANNLPEVLVRRVIKRESGGNPRVISKGNYGLMQIRLGTARALGYRGTAAGLLDADTNMTYAVKYLAGAYHVAGGDHGRAVHYYAAGYYYAAKRKGMSIQAAANPADSFKTALDGNGSAVAMASVERENAGTMHPVPLEPSAKLREARAEGESVSSSSSLYSGHLDYH